MLLETLLFMSVGDQVCNFTESTPGAVKGRLLTQRAGN